MSKKKYPSDSTRSMRRRIQKARERSARQRNSCDIANKLNQIAEELTEPDDSWIRHAIFKIVDQVRAVGVRTLVEQKRVIIAAIKSGCWTVEDISDQTLLPPELVEHLTEKLVKSGKAEWRVRRPALDDTGGQRQRLIILKDSL